MSEKVPPPIVSMPVLVELPSRSRLPRLTAVLSSFSEPPARMIVPVVWAFMVAFPAITIVARSPILTSLEISRVPVKVCTPTPRMVSVALVLPVVTPTVLGAFRTVPAKVPEVSVVSVMSTLSKSPVVAVSRRASTIPAVPLSVPKRSEESGS